MRRPSLYLRAHDMFGTEQIGWNVNQVVITTRSKEFAQASGQDMTDAISLGTWDRREFQSDYWQHLYIRDRRMATIIRARRMAIGMRFLQK